ncbi:hypothetical protein K0B96_06660 [Horticoccus luteus]|uniref:Uncharacterized protein n=1 Tax=Horticoccus luteus TaxID=2862869 RepID=A0A8F9XMJ0_9BACT|nr:hypothetical protein [Horticoccus luteus]QYM80291.1 hypothetical protein K0B96_06660 [Horticoccus luteus]
MKMLRFLSLCLLSVIACGSLFAQDDTPAEPIAFDVTFSAPVDATHFTASSAPAVGAHILAITAEGYVFQLVAEDGHLLNKGAVFGVNVAAPSEAAAPADIRAAIAATIPAP